MADHELPKQIEFFFEEASGYSIVAANGAWAGPTPRDDFKIDFFVESLRVPERVKNEVVDQSHLGPEIEQTPPKQIVRILQVGLLLNVDIAEDIANLILERAAEFRKVEREPNHAD
jgi:hypothetical protein